VSWPRKVSVAIVSWNGRSHLEVCLPALAKQQPAACPHEVLVLDNGSTDGTKEWIQQNHPEVRLIASPVNLGFCAGNNRLVAEADGDAIALLNNDTLPQPEWLGALTEALASAPADVAAVSGQIVDWAGERLDFASGVMTFDGHAFQKDFGRPLANLSVPASGSELLFACGGNMIVRRDSFLAAGGFDESYFAYLEDVDLGWRLWSGGERVLFEPGAIVRHRSMATSQLLGTANRGFLFERNAFLTAYKNYEEELWQRLAPAILLTLSHRTQTLMVQNNPAGDQLTIDPYSGLIANTPSPVSDSIPDSPSQEELPKISLRQKWRGYGRRDFTRRGLRKLARKLLPAWLWEDDSQIPRLTDGRTLAQLRAVTHLLGHLDAAAARRREVQARRKRKDREIFERFPSYVVPTYPGDERLFSSSAFAAWFPDDLPSVRAELAEIMLIED